MFGLFKNRRHSEIAKETSDLVIKETQKLVQMMRLDFQHRFEEMTNQIEQLETKMLVKDIKDKQQYGHLHYKIHEVKSTSLEKDIKGLEKELQTKKII
jgi:hypothetical protein